jgi:beta-phosphoglucomutase-like phosphatase (HAD superfamily)
VRTGLIIEVEALLFDTDMLRAAALHTALRQEGVETSHDDVLQAHAGRPACMALNGIPAAGNLDAVGRDLVLRRAADAVTQSLASGAPSFDARVRDALISLAGEFPLAAVTRSDALEARWLLELAGLESAFLTIRSIADLESADYHTSWSEASARLRADRSVAFGPAPLMPAAQQAGLTTVQVGGGADAGADAQLDSLTQLDASFVSSLFDCRGNT